MQFGRHETFHLRTGWLKACYANSIEDKCFFSMKNAHSTLGVGRNMLNAMRYWSQAFEVLEANTPGKSIDGFKPTKLADIIFKYDEYLEDPASDWLLHYHLVNNKYQCPSIYWIFQKLGGRFLTKQKFIDGIKSFLQKELELKKLPPDSTLERDYSVFVKTYCGIQSENKIGSDILDSPFTHLNIVKRTDAMNEINFSIGPKDSLPSELVAYAIFMMQVGQDKLKPTTVTIDLERLLWEPGSPGMSYKLDGESLLKHLEVIRDKKLLGTMKLDSTAGIKQLTLELRKNLHAIDIIESYYKG